MTVPTVNDYLEQGRANRTHAEWLLTERPKDPTALQWAITATFYSGLHALTAHLESRGIRVRSHTARFQALVDPSSGVPLSVYHAYRILEERSREARYELRVFGFQDVRNLLDRQLASIATFVGM